ncbi:MAG: hypothetical protein ACKO2V_10640, partial [Snowella sp.]
MTKPNPSSPKNRIVYQEFGSPLSSEALERATPDLPPQQQNLRIQASRSGRKGKTVTIIHFASLGWEIHGVDNNQRAVFFGSQGDTRWNQQRLQTVIKGFVHHEVDIRDRQGVLNLIDSLRPDA